MRRIKLVVGIMAVMALMLVAAAAPAMAKGNDHGGGGNGAMHNGNANHLARQDVRLDRALLRVVAAHPDDVGDVDRLPADADHQVDRAVRPQLGAGFGLEADDLAFFYRLAVGLLDVADAQALALG